MVQVGNYQVIKEIGIDKQGNPLGGMGRIFQAKHIYLDEYACLKQNKSQEYAEILYNEAKILWRLNEHHSIPSVKDFFPVDDSYVMVMDYFDGKTLEQTLDGGARLQPEDVCWISERLLGAVYYTHYHGVIHGDIKPANIFVEPQHHDIKLIDFGLASYKPNATSLPSGYTPLFAAPEVTLSMNPIPESDLYGVGLVMLFALGGDVMSKSFHPKTPDRLEEYITRLIRHDPMKRPNWKQENLVETLSDIRMELFGRRHTT